MRRFRTTIRHYVSPRGAFLGHFPTGRLWLAGVGRAPACPSRSALAVRGVACIPARSTRALGSDVITSWPTGRLALLPLDLGSRCIRLHAPVFHGGEAGAALD
jgi:hypothetical protein